MQNRDLAREAGVNGIEKRAKDPSKPARKTQLKAYKTIYCTYTIHASMPKTHVSTIAVLQTPKPSPPLPTTDSAFPRDFEPLPKLAVNDPNDQQHEHRNNRNRDNPIRCHPTSPEPASASALAAQTMKIPKPHNEKGTPRKRQSEGMKEKGAKLTV